MPDFIFAVRDPRAALAAGLDLPALGDAAGRTEADLAERATSRLDEIVLHVLTAAAQVGLRRPDRGRARPARRERRARPADRRRRHGATAQPGRDPAADSPTRVVVIDAVGVRNVLVMGGAPSVSLEDERIQSVAGCSRRGARSRR